MKKFILSILLGAVLLSLFPGPAEAKTTNRDSLILKLAKADNDTIKILILNRLANDYINNDTDISLDYTQEMVELINRQALTDKKGAYYADAAILYLNCNIYDKALDLLFKALKIFEISNNQYSIAITKNTMGGVYFRLGKMEQALQCFNEGMEICEEKIAQGDSSFNNRLHLFYNNISLIYYTQEDKRPLAGSYLEKAIATVPPDDYRNLSQYYNNIASFYYEQGKTEQAYDCAYKSLKYRKALRDDNGIARSFYTLASLYYTEKKLPQAQLYLDSALSIGMKLKSNLLLKDVYKLNLAIAENRADYRAANQYLKKIYDIQHLLINDTILARTTAIKMEYDYEKKAAIQELNIQKARFKSNLLTCILITLLIVSILIFLLVRNRNKRIQLEKENLEKDLEVKNKELTTNVIYLMRNTDMIRQVIQKLIEIRPSIAKENVETIKKVIMNLQSLMKDDIWNEFETHFNQVHLDFYKKIKKRCPDLTPAELKLCAFLRLNMSSKEISSLTGITVKSVEVMRARLRKKLNITNTDINLVNYLSEF